MANKTNRKGGYFPHAETVKWATPPQVLEKLNAEFGPFDYDPCPIDWEEGRDPDGLKSEWGQRNFVNPPYDNVSAWFRKAHEEWQKGKLVVLLTNAVTDNAVFHDLVLGNAELRFVRGRIQFIDPRRPDFRAGNVRPSMLTIFRPGERNSTAAPALLQALRPKRASPAAKAPAKAPPAKRLRRSANPRSRGPNVGTPASTPQSQEAADVPA